MYKANRATCHRNPKSDGCQDFSKWVIRQVQEHKWSLDACCGYAKLHHLFEPSKMVCSRTLYNMVWRGCLPIHPTELPEALKRKTKKHRVRENKSVTAQAFQTVRRLLLSAWKKATGRAIPWLEGGLERSP